MKKYNVQVVYEKDKKFFVDCEPYEYKKVGIKIDSRIIWLGGIDNYSDENEYCKCEELANDIVNSLKILQQNAQPDMNRLLR